MPVVSWAAGRLPRVQHQIASQEGLQYCPARARVTTQHILRFTNSYDV